MKKNKATLIHHQGFGDLFTNNSLCHFYADQYDELVVLTYTESRLKVLQAMYDNCSNIRCEKVDLTPSYNGVDACLNCMTYGSPNWCPRDGSICKFIDYSKFKDFENIKIGCFDDFSKWESFYTSERRAGSSFSHAFYKFHNIPLKDRIDRFFVSQDVELQKQILESVTNEYGNDYIVTHRDTDRNFSFNVGTDVIEYNLHSKSQTMIDQIAVIENAKEIHMIDSSYSVLVYFLSFFNEKIRAIPKYLHTLGRKERDIKIYNNPTPENWHFK